MLSETGARLNQALHCVGPSVVVKLGTPPTRIGQAMHSRQRKAVRFVALPSFTRQAVRSCFLNTDGIYPGVPDGRRPAPWGRDMARHICLGILGS